MNVQTILENFRRAFAKLSSIRVIITSPREKIADISALYAILALVMVPAVCVGAALLGLIFRYRIRFEQDTTRGYY